jgi:hypothetical protein
MLTLSVLLPEHGGRLPGAWLMGVAPFTKLSREVLDFRSSRDIDRMLVGSEKSFTLQIVPPAP